MSNVEYIVQVGWHIGRGAAESNMPANVTSIYSMLGDNSVLVHSVPKK